MDATGRRTEFVLENPHKIANFWQANLYTDRPELINLAENFEGVSSIQDLHTVVFVEFMPQYDHEVVWLNLYEALSEASHIGHLWYEALGDKHEPRKR